MGSDYDPNYDRLKGDDAKPGVPFRPTALSADGMFHAGVIRGYLGGGVIRVYFSGGAASGKTTLSKRLSTEFRLALIPSAARRTMKALGLTPDDVRKPGQDSFRFQRQAGETMLQDEADAVKNGWSFVSDRCGADQLAYGVAQSGHGDELVRYFGAAFKERVTDPDALVFLVEPNPEAIKNAKGEDVDGDRQEWLSEAEVRETYGACKVFLDLWGVRYVRVPSMNHAAQWDLVKRTYRAFVEDRVRARRHTALTDAVANGEAEIVPLVSHDPAKTIDIPPAGRIVTPESPKTEPEKVNANEEVYEVGEGMAARLVLGCDLCPNSPEFKTAKHVGTLRGFMNLPGRFSDGDLNFIANAVARTAFQRGSLPGLMNDWEIQSIFKDRHGDGFGEITPFDNGTKKELYISSGLSSGGYDFKLGEKFKMFSNVNQHLIDPLRIDERAFQDVTVQEEKITLPDGSERTNKFIVLPAGSYVLAETVEFISIPRNVLIVLLGKSTYARLGIILNCTPLEPGWKGRVTLEIANTAPTALKLYCNMGIAQGLFFRLTKPAVKDYSERSGRYQNQPGLTLPKSTG